MAQKEEILSEGELNEVMQFASGLYGYLNGKNGVYTPWTQNEMLKHLSNNPKDVDIQGLDKALRNALDNEELLGDYSQFMEIWDTIYRKTIDMYSSILSFDYRLSAINVKSPEEYASDDYLSDKRRFYKFMNRFDYRAEFNMVVKYLLLRGRYFTWLRTSEGVINDNPLEDDEIKRLPKYALQTMPQERCIITGKSTEGYLYDLDMSYWLNPTVDINLYAPNIKTKFKDAFIKNQNFRDYLPTNKLNDRNGTYVTWAQTSPDEGAWCFVWDDGNPNAIPPFSNLMKATFDNTELHKLQMNKNLASAYALLHGEIGLISGAKGGEKANSFSIDPATMGMFMNLVQSGLKSVMKTVALPLQNTDFSQFQDYNENMEDKGLDVSSAQGAFANSLIYSSGKKGQAEVLNGITADYNLMAKLYKQFARFIEFYANKKTNKYKFKVVFEGSNFPHERKERRERVTTLADRGFTLNASAWAQAFGYDCQEFEEMLAEASHGNLSKLMMLPLNANTMTKGEEVGNPTKDVSDLSDSGATSQEYE